MKMKKILVLLLSMVMLLGMFAGCSNRGGEDTYPTIDFSTPITVPTGVSDHDWQDITISVSGQQGATDDWNSTVVVAKMKEMFGVTMECNPYSTDDWSTKFTLMITEDDLPDLILSSGKSIKLANQNGMEGAFLNFMDYIQYMPNLVAFLNEHTDYRKYVTAADSGIYGLTQYNEAVLDNIPRCFINTQWLENLGLEYPETVDDLYKVLKAFKEQDANGNGDPNDEIPLMWSGDYSRTVEHTLMAAFGIYPPSATATTYFTLQVVDGEVQLMDATENMKAYLKYMNKLWEEDLIYDESYSISIKAQRELTKKDLVGVFADSAGWTARGNGDPTDDYYYRNFAGLTSDYNDSAVVVRGNTVGAACYFLVNANTEHPEEICRMIDYFFSDEGALMGQWGDVESYCTYEPSNIPGLEDVYEWTTPSTAPDGYDSWETYRHKYQTINNAFNVRALKANTEDALLAMSADELQAAIDAKAEGVSLYSLQAAWRIVGGGLEIVSGYPGLVYTETQADERSPIVTDITSYCQTQKAMFITGVKDIDANWDSFLAELESMGLPELLEIEQAAYDAMYGKD